MIKNWKISGLQNTTEFFLFLNLEKIPFQYKEDFFQVLKIIELMTRPIGNSNLVPRLETRQSQMRHFKKPRFPCFKLEKLDLTDLWQNYIHLLCHKWVWSTFETQNMGNKAFQNASFENASFGNGNEDSSCLSAELA